MKIGQDNNMVDCTDEVYAKNEAEYSCRSNWVWFVTKIRQDNDVIDRIGLVYAKIEIELSGPIIPGAVYDENQIRQ